MKNLTINNSIINYLLGIFSFIFLFSVSIDKNFTFFLLVILIIFFIFFDIQFKINIVSLILFLILFSINFINFYKIEEKNNIFIPNKFNESKYLRYLNKDEYSILKDDFFISYNVEDRNCKINDDTCWRNLRVSDGISYNLNIFFKNKNYSRLITNINHNDLATIKINETNNLNLNFFKKNIFKRETMPYFVNYKFPKFLDNSKICFKGKLIVNKKLIHQKYKKCIKASHENNYLFYNFNYLEIDLKKNFKSLIIEYFILLLNIFVIYIFFNNSTLSKKDFFNKVVVISLSIIAFLYFFYRRDDFVIGYHALNGGMDGLLHESFGKDIFTNFANGNLIEALRGNEDVYYFMPGMRYFLFLEKLLFGNNFYLIYLIMIFLPLSIYYFLNIFFKNNISLVITVLFLFLNIPHLGFGSSIYYKSLLTLYPEGVMFFFLIIGIINIFNKNFLLGALFLSFAIFLRPNFLLFVFLTFFIHLLILFRQNKIKDVIKLIIGISFVLLIPLHNYAFKKDNFYVLTSSSNINSNKVLSFNDYSNILYTKKISTSVVNHLKNFINTGINKKYVFLINFILLINLIIFFLFKINKFKIEEQIFLSSTIVQIFPSFFFINTGRFAIVVWFLIFISNLIIFKYLIKKFKNINLIKKY